MIYVIDIHSSPTISHECSHLQGQYKLSTNYMWGKMNTI